MIGRTLAWILLVLALFAAGRDGLLFLETGAYTPATLGEMWYAINPGSLNWTQAIIERHAMPWLWQSVIFPVLIAPAWAVLGAAGLVIGVLFGRGGRKRRRSSFS
jgi:hypothetical protein